MIQHPNDRQLQQYLNSACSPHATQSIHAHVKSCAPCFRKLEQYIELNRRLDGEQLLNPAPGFADRVMRSVQTPASPERPKRIRWNTEFVHTSIAGIATYMFISTGILRKLTAFDGHTIGTQVQTRVSTAVQHIEHVVRWISSF